jgi:hypothetical protein
MFPPKTQHRPPPALILIWWLHQVTLPSVVGLRDLLTNGQVRTIHRTNVCMPIFPPKIRAHMRRITPSIPVTRVSITQTKVQASMETMTPVTTIKRHPVPRTSIHLCHVSQVGAFFSFDS